MKALVSALMAEVKLGFVKMMRYPVQTVTSVLVLYLLFAGVFYGSRYISGAGGGGSSEFSQSATEAIAGYVLWFFALIAIDSMSQNVAEEAQTGTLEQLYLSRWSFSMMLFLRFLAAVLSSVVMLVPLLFLMSISTGIPIGWQLGRTLPVVGLTVLGLCGMGYLLGAITLVFKRIGNAMTLVQFGLLFLCMPPIGQLPRGLRYLALALPPTQGVKVLRSIVTDRSVPLLSTGLALLLLTSLTYVIIGLVVFHQAERIAKDRGLLGHY